MGENEGKASTSSDGRHYVIWRTPGAGFFSIVTSTLAHIHIATSRGLVPIVDFENHHSVYLESQPVRGATNMWEYYFQQPMGQSVIDITPDDYTVDGTWPKGYPYSLSSSPIYREMWDKHIRLTPTTQRYIDSSLETLEIGPSSLGVHFRGQEMRTTKGHHYPPTLRQAKKAIIWSLENSDCDSIFLVTEAQQYVRYFVKSFGSRVIPSPSFRLAHQNSYTLRDAPRRNHRYLLGLEALRDAIALSRCAGLVCGRSNLSEAALMLAGGSTSQTVRISQGRNSFRPYISPVKWYLKASLPPLFGGFPKWEPPASKSQGR